MLLPTLFDNGFWNNWDTDLTEKKNDFMRTDVKDCGDHFEFITDMPGYHKEDIKAKLEKGVLTIDATRNETNEEKDEQGRYVRRERFTGTCSRSFYVGDELDQDDIKARFSDGVLTLDVPKRSEKQEENRYIAIEG